MEALTIFNLRINDIDKNLAGTDADILQLQNVLNQLEASVSMRYARLLNGPQNLEMIEYIKNLKDSISYIDPFISIAYNRNLQTIKIITNAKLLSQEDDNEEVLNVATANIFASLCTLRSTVCSIYKMSILLTSISTGMNIPINDNDLQYQLNQFYMFAKALSFKLSESKFDTKVRDWVHNAIEAALKIKTDC